MKLLDKTLNNLRESLRDFIFRGVSEYDYYTKTFKSLDGLGYSQEEGNVWYQANAYKLQDFYNYYCNGADDVKTENFWAKSPKQAEIRKIHSGVANEIIEQLTQVTLGQGTEVTIEDNEEAVERLTEILKSEGNNFEATANKSLRETLAIGDGAFKITIDTEKFDTPIIEWEDGRFVDYVYERNKLMEIIFKTEYAKDNKKYVLLEKYGRGYIRYELYKVANDSMKKVELTAIEETNDLDPEITYNTDTILAVPFKIKSNPEYKNRGRGILAGKYEMLDALDENLSISADALRDGRVQTYVPENKAPKDRNTGRILPPNKFNRRFIVTEADTREGANNEIKAVQPKIDYKVFYDAHSHQLKTILNGIISPSTLGMDFANRDNAEAQREREKTTLSTRMMIVRAMKPVLEQLYKVVLISDDLLKNKTVKEYDVKLMFGEYGTPTFESKVKTMAEAKFKGIISNELLVDQLWSDELSEEKKLEEIERLNKKDNPTEVDINNIFDEE